MRVYVDPAEVTPDNWSRDLIGEHVELVLDRATAAYWYAVGRQDAGEEGADPYRFRDHHAAEAVRFHRIDVDCYFLDSIPDSYTKFMEGQG